MSPPSEDRRLRIGELARLTSVSPDTLRHYERRGVLQKPERLDNNYRLYPFSAVERVRLIRSALAIGFTIDEVADILAERRRNGVPCRRVRALAQAKLDQVEELIRILETKRDDLTGLLASWDAALAATPEGMRAGLLEKLVQRGKEEER